MQPRQGLVIVESPRSWIGVSLDNYFQIPATNSFFAVFCVVFLLEIIEYLCHNCVIKYFRSLVGYHMGANREYKNSVFTTLFNDESNLLSLYNAVSGSELPLDTPLEIATLEDVLFTDRRNDIAFVLEDKIVILLEHQSTINENMPLRMLIYIARVYEKLIDNEAIYKKKLLKIPKPDFIVLYNGTDPFPDERSYACQMLTRIARKQWSGLAVR